MLFENLMCGYVYVDKLSTKITQKCEFTDMLNAL